MKAPSRPKHGAKKNQEASGSLGNRLLLLLLMLLLLLLLLLLFAVAVADTFRDSWQADPYAIVVPDGQRRLLSTATEKRCRRNRATNGKLLSAL